MRHTENCENHSIQKAKKRYGLELTHEDIKRMVKLIQKGQSESLINAGTKTRSRSFHKIFYKDVWLRVVYSKTMKTIVTVLPPEKRIPVDLKRSGKNATHN